MQAGLEDVRHLANPERLGRRRKDVEENLEALVRKPRRELVDDIAADREEAAHRVGERRLEQPSARTRWRRGSRRAGPGSARPVVGRVDVAARHHHIGLPGAEDREHLPEAGLVVLQVGVDQRDDRARSSPACLRARRRQARGGGRGGSPGSAAKPATRPGSRRSCRPSNRRRRRWLPRRSRRAPRPACAARIGTFSRSFSVGITIVISAGAESTAAKSSCGAVPGAASGGSVRARLSGLRGGALLDLATSPANKPSFAKVSFPFETTLCRPWPRTLPMLCPYPFGGRVSSEQARLCFGAATRNEEQRRAASFAPRIRMSR